MMLNAKNIKKLSILIVDDHYVVHLALSHIMQKISVCNIYTSATIEDAKQKLSTYKIDIVFLDIDLEGESGIEFVPYMKKKYPWLKIIFFSMIQDYGVIKKAMNLGVSGFIPKLDEEQKIITKISSILSGKKIFPNFILEENKTSHGYSKVYIESVLTKKEIKILREIHAGKTSKEIASLLNISKLTVDKHRQNIHKKLKVKSSIELVKLTREIT